MNFYLKYIIAVRFGCGKGNLQFHWVEEIIC